MCLVKYLRNSIKFSMPSPASSLKHIRSIVNVSHIFTWINIILQFFSCSQVFVTLWLWWIKWVIESHHLIIFFWHCIIKHGPISFLCLSPVSSCFSFSLCFPVDSRMTCEQIEQNINCLPNLCKCMLIYTLIDSQRARYLDRLERPGRDSVCVTLKVASSIPSELSLRVLASQFNPEWTGIKL